MEKNIELIQKMAIEYAPKVAGALITLVVGLWIIKRIAVFAEKRMQNNGFDDTIRPFLVSLISVGLKVILLLAVASMFGIKTTSFIAIFGALAFAIGMALQGSLGHFASGVLLLVFKPYKVGDLVTLGGGQTGAVESIQIFNTVLKTLDNKRIIIPNGVVTSNVMTNISGQGTVGVELTFGIGYDDNIDAARKIILEVGQSCPHILKDPEQGVVVAELADNSVNLATRPFTNSEHYWDVFFYMQEHVKKEFDKAGIGIPYPQMDVHVKS